MKCSRHALHSTVTPPSIASASCDCSLRSFCTNSFSGLALYDDIRFQSDRSNGGAHGETRLAMLISKDSSVAWLILEPSGASSEDVNEVQREVNKLHLL